MKKVAIGQEKRIVLNKEKTIMLAIKMTEKGAAGGAQLVVFP